jgi:enoyl-CoA hydratase/carnithine racemase
MVLLSERKGKILEISLNRPERGNSLDISTLIELHNLIFEAQKTENINVIVLTGSGSRDFCTGIDIKSASLLGPEDRTNLANVAGDIATALYYGKPSVVIANGRSMGMGLVFACAADFAIVCKDAVCQMPEIDVGIFPGASCIAIMNRKIGIRKTAEILMTGSPFSAEKAVQYGIFNQMAETNEIKEIGRNFAKLLSRKPAVLVKLLKLSIISSLDLDYNRVIKLEEDASSWAKWRDPDFQIEKLLQTFGIAPEYLGDLERLKAFADQKF